MPSADHDIIQQLNAVLKIKLTGINQYFLHARMLKHRGDVKLADYEYKASIDAMKHADMLVEHILGSGGLPQLQELGTLAIGAEMHEMMRNDLALAESALAQIKSTIALCDKNDNKTTAALLNRILESHMEHIAFLRTQTKPTMKDCA